MIVRTNSEVGGTEGLSAIIVERNTPGITYKHINKEGSWLFSNAEIIFDNAVVPAANLLPGAAGNSDFVINRNFAWSGPVAAKIEMSRYFFWRAADYLDKHAQHAVS